MFNITEMFHSIAGESPRPGRNVVFLRLAKCTLKCQWCDSKYSWEDGRDIPIESVINYIKSARPQGLCITGGEPLLQQDEILKLINSIDREVAEDKINNNFHIEIETNGTIMPREELLDHNFVYFNVSPKLEGSGNSKENRYKPEILKQFTDESYNKGKNIFKFVYTNGKDIDEIEEIIEENNIRKNQIYLMAEGVTSQEQSDKQQQTIQIALDHGWNFSPRLHVLIWGTKRGV